MKVLTEDRETLTTAQDTVLREMCLELLHRIDTFRWDVKRKHWNAPDWGTHLDFDQIQSDLGDTLDTFAEVYFMSRNIDVDISKSEYHSTDISKSIDRMLELCHAISVDQNTTDGITNFVNGFAQDLEQYSGWNRITTPEDIKSEKEIDNTQKESIEESVITESIADKKPLGEFDSYAIEQILYQFIPQDDESENELQLALSELIEPINAEQVDSLLDKLKIKFNWQPSLMDVIEDKIIESKDIRQERIEEFNDEKSTDIRNFEELVSEDNTDVNLLASRKILQDAIEYLKKLEYNGDSDTVYSVYSLKTFKRRNPNKTPKYIL